MRMLRSILLAKGPKLQSAHTVAGHLAQTAWHYSPFTLTYPILSLHKTCEGSKTATARCHCKLSKHPLSCPGQSCRRKPAAVRNATPTYRHHQHSRGDWLAGSDLAAAYDCRPSAQSHAPCVTQLCCRRKRAAKAQSPQAETTRTEQGRLACRGRPAAVGLQPWAQARTGR